MVNNTRHCPHSYAASNKTVSKRGATSVATLKKSKTLDGPLKKPQKTPGQICTGFGKNRTFSQESGFFRKNFWWLFLVINPDFFYIFYLFFTKNHLLSSKKHSKICIFRGNLKKPRKTLDLFKNSRKTQNPRSGRKKPRSGEKTLGVATLGATLVIFVMAQKVVK